MAASSDRICFSLDAGQCIGCAICADVCTQAALAFDRQAIRPEWDSSRCNGCMECQLQCPTGAIEVSSPSLSPRKPAGPTGWVRMVLVPLLLFSLAASLGAKQVAAQRHPGCLRNLQSPENEKRVEIDGVGFIYREVGTGGVAIVSCFPASPGSPRKLAIPGEIAGRAVVRVDASFFLCGSWVRELSIPASLTNFPPDRIHLFRRLEAIEVDGANPVFQSLDGVLFSRDGERLLAYPCKRKGAVYVLPAGVREVGKNAFRGAEGVKEVVLPPSLERIGDSAFMRCSNLRKIMLPRNLSVLGGWVWMGCAALERIEVDPDNPVFSAKSGVLFGEKGKRLVRMPEGWAGSYRVPNGVEKIADWAFSGCRKLVAVDCPPSLESMGDYVFSGCCALRSVAFPAALKEVGKRPFDSCKMLERVEIDAANSSFANLSGMVFDLRDKRLLACLKKRVPKTLVVPEGVAEVPYRFFSGCGKLESATLPDSVERIGPGAFSYCTNLTEIALPSGLKEIASSLFSDCWKLREIQLPEPLESIGSFAFRNCRELEHVVIPSNTVRVSAHAFAGCTNLAAFGLQEGNSAFAVEEGVLYSADFSHLVAFPPGKAGVLHLPETVEEIPPRAFMSGRKLEAVVLPPRLRRIGGSAFSECTNLRRINLPKTLVVLEPSAFSGCARLESIHIPAATTNIGQRVFWNCDSLESLTVNPENPRYAACQNLLVDKLTGEVLFCPKSYAGELRLPDGLVRVAPWSFLNRPGITKVVLPASLKEIGRNAFYGCGGLKTVEWPDGLEKIGKQAFGSCTNLVALTFPRGLKKIESEAFRGCKSLREVQFPSGLETIGESAFCDTGITNIFIPASVIRIAENSFSLCGALGAIKVDADNPEYASVDGVLYGKNPLRIVRCSPRLPESIELPEGLEQIPDRAFMHQKRLKHVRLPSSLRSIGKSAFWDCRELQEIVVPEKVDGIAESSFRSCANLERVVLPEGLRWIGNWAFSDCSSLERINLPDSLKTIKKGAFFKSGLKGIVLPDGVETVEDDAFGWIFHGMRWVWLGKSVRTLSAKAFWLCYSARQVRVDPGNRWFMERGGILYSRDGTRLVWCPPSALVPAVFSIPDGVVEVAPYAFAGCKWLKEVRFPASVESIGEYAFDACPRLVVARLPDGLRSLGECAFLDCRKLEEAPVPASVEMLGKNVFQHCEKIGASSDAGGALTNLCGVVYSEDFSRLVSCSPSVTGVVKIAEGVGVVPPGIFRSLDKITRIVLPDSVWKLDGEAFNNCPGLRAIHFGKGVREIVSFFERKCPRLERIEVDPENPNFCDREGVLFDKSMKTLLRYPAARGGKYVVPEGVEVLGDFSFEGCSNLVEIVLPESLQRIEGWAFRGCASLVRLRIPEKVSFVPTYAFGGNSSLVVIDVAEGNKSYTDIDGVLYDRSLTRLVRCPQAKKGRVRIPDGVSTIPQNAFYECSGVTNVVFPKGLKTIVEFAFYHCRGLRGLELPEGLETIERLAFCGCTGIEEVVFPDSLELLGERAFWGDKALRRVVFGKNLREVPPECFAECTRLERVVLPEGLERIKDRAFDRCASLERLKIPSTVEKIDPSAFARCTSLSGIEVAPGNPHYAVRGGVLRDTRTGAAIWPPVKPGK